MNEETLFHEALARSTPRERAAFLDEACAGRPELRSAVEALLAAHEQPGEFLRPMTVVAPRRTDDEPADPVTPAPTPETENLAGSTGADGQPLDPGETSDGPGSSPAPAAAERLPERIGRYEVRRLLGRGGMGAVYLAHDPELDRPVALKVPKLDGPDAEERFLREARAAAAITHPNLCSVYDVGRADGVPYLAMAYVPGPTLTEVIRKDGPLPAARAAAIAAAIARGMAEAHRHGIVHRDLKPGNILMDRKGEPVVTDFGLALRAGGPTLPATPAATVHPSPRLTQPGILMGTPAYMPPEQARGELDRIGPASDVYALGAILFEMLTGQRLFSSCPIHEMVRLIETQPAPVPSTIRRGIPPGLDAICRRALAKDPAKRFASMDEFAEALAPFAAQVRRRRWGRLAVAAAVLALLIGIAGVVFYVKTDNGTVEIRINDPAAAVQVAVDGNTITLTEGTHVTKLRAGPHALEVKGEGYETETKLFRVRRGENTPVEVELKKTYPPPSPPDRAKLARLLHDGGKLIQQGRFGELDTVVAEALKIDPESPGALALRATARASRGDVEGAQADVEAALKLNPETLQALLVRSYLSTRAGKPDDTIADVTIVIRIDPEFTPAWSNRAAAYLNRGDYRQAIADATRVIEKLWAKRPDLNAYVSRAGAYACLGEYDKALADYKTAIDLAPNNPTTWFLRSALYVKLGDAEKAAADWQKAKSLDQTLRLESRPVLPDPPKPVQRKKLTDVEKKELERALVAFERAWETNDGPGCERAADEARRIDPTCAAAHAARSRHLAEMHRYKEALAEANEAIRLDANDAWAYSVRAAARTDANDLAGAIADATISLRLNGSIAETWNARGWAYRLRGQPHQAIADLTEAIRLRPNYQLPYQTRGYAFLHLGEYKKALADFVKLTELQPTVAKWWMTCAAIRARLGDAPGARNDREVALNINKKQPDVNLPVPLPPVKTDPELPEPVEVRPQPHQSRLAELLASGRKLVDDGWVNQIEAIVTEALKIDPESPGGLGLRAVYRHGAKNDLAGAREDAKAALRLNPETFYALAVRAELNGVEGKYDDTIADLTVAVRLAPGHPVPWARRAEAYLAKKEYRQAIADADRAIELGRRPPDALVVRADARVLLGEYEKALEDLDAVVQRAPGSPLPYLKRSLLHAKLGHAGLAAADWKRAKEIEPDLPEEARRAPIPDPPRPVERRKLSDTEKDAVNLALKTAEEALHQQRVAEARKAIEKAIQLNPTSAEAHALRARLLGHTDQFEQALKEADEAIRLDPNHAWAYTARGAARASLKDFAGAIADHTIAIRLNPKLHAAWGNRSHAYNLRGQYHQSLADVSEALRLKSGDWIALRNRGGSHLYLGEYKEALADYVEVAKLQPKNGRWLLICAAIREKLGDPDEAAKDRKKAVEVDPQIDPAAPIDLPPPLPPAKKDPELPHDPGPEATRPPIDRDRLAELLANGRKLVYAGRWSQLDVIVTEALKIDPESPGALALRAVYRLSHENDRAGARADVEAALKLNPEIFHAFVIRADLNGQEGKFDDAIADATIAERLEPKHPAPLPRRARAYLEIKEPRQALLDANRAIDLGYDSPDVFLTRAGAYVFLGEYEKALKDLDAAAARAPSLLRVFTQRSVIHAKLGHADLAAEDWKKAKVIFPNLPETARPVIPDPPKPPERKKLTDEQTRALTAALKAAQTAWDLARIDDCNRAAEEAVGIDPTSAAAREMRARVWGQQGRFQEARKEADEAIRLDPNLAEAYFTRGSARSNLNEPAGAIADFTIAIQRAPSLALAWNNRGWAYMMRGQYHQALADFNEALQRKEWASLTLPNRGMCYLHLGEYEKALDDYVEAARLQPTNGRWPFISSAIRARLGDPDGAARDRQRALDLDKQLADAPAITLPPPISPVKKDPEPPSHDP
jgi:tetratricopeptide (TPR) repeat protein